MKSKPLAIAIFVLAVALLIGFYSIKKTNSENNSTENATPARGTKIGSGSAKRSSLSKPAWLIKRSQRPSRARDAQKIRRTLQQYLGDDSISIEDAATDS